MTVLETNCVPTNSQSLYVFLDRQLFLWPCRILVIILQLTRFTENKNILDIKCISFSLVFLLKLFLTQKEISCSEMLSYRVELSYNIMKEAEYFL
jgi:hypothetical protein